MLVSLSKIGEVNFYVIGTNGFLVKIHWTRVVVRTSNLKKIECRTAFVQPTEKIKFKSSVQSICCALSLPSDAVALLPSHCSVKEVHLLDGCTIIRQNKILAIFSSQSVSLALVISATLTEMGFLSLRKHPMHVRWRKFKFAQSLRKVVNVNVLRVLPPYQWLRATKK